MKQLLKKLGLGQLYWAFYNWISQLRSQAIFLTVLLLLLMTVLAVGVAFLAYRQVSQTLAESRDQELAIIGAERLSEQMESLLRGLLVLADQPEMQSGEPTVQIATLTRGRELVADLANHDGGIIILDANGFVGVTKPFRPDLVGQDFSQESYFQNAKTERTFTFSNILEEPGTGQDVIVIAVPIINRLTDEFVGVLAVRFYTDFQRLGPEIEKLKVGDKGIAYLVDQNGRLIYHPNDSLIGTDFSQREAVRRLNSGERAGAITSLTGGQDSTVEGYAVVPITNWGLVIGEPWEQVIEPAQVSLRPVIIILIVGLVIVASVVSVGVQRVTDPIQNLVIQTRQVTSGDYDAQVSLSRIKEIGELGTAFNEMVQQISRYRVGLREYVADMTRSQEEERKRIARDLHDDTVQTLIAIGQRLELVKGSLDDTEQARARLTDVRAMVTGAIASVRQFSRDLRPLALEDLGLAAAMQYLANQLAQSEGVDVNLTVEGQAENLSNDMEIAIYRILQEALNNVKKHAHATEVNVLAQFTDQQIKMVVQDDGQGFEMPEAITDFASSGHFGVMGLHERAQLFGGQVTVESEPGQGTTVTLILPRQSELGQFGLENMNHLRHTRPDGNALTENPMPGVSQKA
ncbi:MAG: HAMP domain-containing protein [Chloroflexi bacterium]|nr:MAG: HAMP domain-containing protein [Chloroflexota bacterium]